MFRCRLEPELNGSWLTCLIRECLPFSVVLYYLVLPLESENPRHSFRRSVTSTFSVITLVYILLISRSFCCFHCRRSYT